jgi:hypothetical protein
MYFKVVERCRCCSLSDLQHSPAKEWDMPRLHRFVITCLMAGSLLFLSRSTEAALLAEWDFELLTDGGGQTLAASITDSAVTASALRGNGVPIYAGPMINAPFGTWGSNNLAENSQASAISASAYFAFSVTPSVPGVSITEIAQYRTYIDDYDPTLNPPAELTGIWQYSIDSTNYTDIGTSFLLGTVDALSQVQPAIDLSGITDLQTLATGTTAELRFVVWGGAYGANYGGFGTAGPGVSDFAVNGTVPVPEPAAIASLATGAAFITGLFGYRRRRRRS